MNFYNFISYSGPKSKTVKSLVFFYLSFTHLLFYIITHLSQNVIVNGIPLPSCGGNNLANRHNQVDHYALHPDERKN